MTHDLKSREQAARGIYSPELERELKRSRGTILSDIGAGGALIAIMIIGVALIFLVRAGF